MNARGTEPANRGKSARQLTSPARWSLNVARVATRMFSVSAVGFMTTGGTPTRAMAARYPDAPAWPTDV